MAVKVKSLITKDKRSPQPSSTIHYIKVNKSNKKGAAEAIGGKLLEHFGHRNGDFHILLPTISNKKKTTTHVEAGMVVFRTNDSKTWQALWPEALKKRFPDAKFV